jgi:hypothetical protein
MDLLIEKVQAGENIMVKKVLIDRYLKSQVDLVTIFLYSAETIRQAQSDLPILLHVSVRRRTQHVL